MGAGQLPHATDVEQTLDRVEDALERGDAEEALELCETVLQLHPDHAGAWFLSAEAYRDLRELESAETRYQRVTHLDPEYSPGWSGLGAVRFEMLQFEAAQRACRDKLPAGLASLDQEITPERLQAQLAFSACMRGKGVKGFPDPTPKGVFELGEGSPDLNTPAVQQAVRACMQSNPPGGLMIRRMQKP